MIALEIVFGIKSMYHFVNCFNFFQTIKSKDAWNSPENSTDFPNCHFEISHVDKRKQSFFCVITASHGKDSARAEIVEYFERVSR